MYKFKAIIAASALVIIPSIASANAVFKWEFLSFNSPVQQNFNQSDFLSDEVVQDFFPVSITITDLAFANDLAFRYLKPNPSGGFDGVNDGVVSISASAPFGFTCTLGDDPPCDIQPRFSLFGGIVVSGSDTLFGGAVALPAPIPGTDLDLALCLVAQPTLGEYCARDRPAANIAVNLTSDASGLWTGHYFATVGISGAADFTGRYVLENGTPVSEPSTPLAILLGLSAMGLLKRRRGLQACLTS